MQVVPNAKVQHRLQHRLRIALAEGIVRIANQNSFDRLFRALQSIFVVSHRFDTEKVLEWYMDRQHLHLVVDAEAKIQTGPIRSGDQNSVTRFAYLLHEGSQRKVAACRQDEVRRRDWDARLEVGIDEVGEGGSGGRAASDALGVR